MFREIGERLDEFIEKIRVWNTQRAWYKIYAHIYIINKIKSKAFMDEEHFKYFIETTFSNNQISKWQHQKLYNFYLSNNKDNQG